MNADTIRHIEGHARQLRGHLCIGALAEARGS
jgi:hypothetical protein